MSIPIPCIAEFSDAPLAVWKLGGDKSPNFPPRLKKNDSLTHNPIDNKLPVSTKTLICGLKLLLPDAAVDTVAVANADPVIRWDTFHNSSEPEVSTWVLLIFGAEPAVAAVVLVAVCFLHASVAEAQLALLLGGA